VRRGGKPKTKPSFWRTLCNTFISWYRRQHEVYIKLCVFHPALISRIAKCTLYVYSGGNTSDLYSGGSWLTPWPRHWLPWCIFCAFPQSLQENARAVL
jgi:hypothetical protein